MGRKVTILTPAVIIICWDVQCTSEDGEGDEEGGAKWHAATNKMTESKW